MAAGRYSFTLEQGTTVDFELRYKDSGSNPIDLTGYTGKMEIRSNYSGSGETFLTLTSSLGDVYDKQPNNAFLSFSGSNLSTPTASGSIGIYIGYELADKLNFTPDAFYDLEITTGINKTRVIEGRVLLSRQTTD
jgi:hypothetical protein